MKSINHIKKWSLIVLGGAFLNSCSDFLDKQPLDSFTSDNFWSSENNVRTFNNSNFEVFLGYGNGAGTTAEFYFHSASQFDDNLTNRDLIIFNTAANATNGNWNTAFTQIKRANLMLEKVPSIATMDQTKKNHFIGVAKFFRAYNYFNLVEQFGDVPYYDKYITVDNPDVYKPASPRAEVMDKIIMDLEDASNLMLAADGNNTNINKYTALALLARVSLYEGTYKKYQLNQSGAAYFTKAKAAALQIMNSKVYALNTNWKDNFNAVELLNNKEQILCKRYENGIFMHSIQAYTNSSTRQNGMSKFAAESYVTANGLPIKQVGGNPQFVDDNTPANTFANRDKRFSQVNLPTNYYYGTVTSPNALTSSTGYLIELYNNPLSTGVGTINANFTDAPIFSYAEVLLNYAEASAELGTISNSDLDISINLLRTRAGIAKLTTDGTNASAGGIVINDPQRTSALEQITGAVNPIIWEVRRERRVELMTWTYLRRMDLNRWKKGDYLDSAKNPDLFLGARVPSLIGNTTSTVKVNAQGYILPYANNPSRSFVAPKHYLNAIPVNEIMIYKAEGVTLKQNPGWE